MKTAPPRALAAKAPKLWPTAARFYSSLHTPFSHSPLQMSGARGFHHSDSDHKRSFAGSRAFTYESGRGGMSDILTHTNVETRAPMARSGAGMASILDHATPSENAKPQFSSSMLPSNASQYTSAGMMDVMRGVGQMGVDDALHGLGRRTLNQKHSGAGALAALRGEEAEAGMDDPFAHTRGGARAKLHPRDAGMEVALPNMGIPGTLDAATRDVMAARAAGAPSSVAARTSRSPRSFATSTMSSTSLHSAWRGRRRQRIHVWVSSDV